ncbi:MAG TPA: EamA family transporter [Afifellaceae bacterium]|nr:EamA family transporter [Afifellaceae bacterium]
MFGALLAFGSAAFFGLNSAMVRRGVINATVLQGMAITVPLGVPLFLAFALVIGGFGAMADWPPMAYVWMALAGIAHFVIGRYGNYRATQAIGGTLSTPVQQLSVLVALLLGFLFLGETVNVLNTVGIVLVVFGPMILLRRRKAVSKAGNAKGFEPHYPSGLFWGAVCAIGYGTSPLFIALGLGESGGAADGAAGGLVSYLAATAAVGFLVIAAGGRRSVAALDRSAVGWFLLSALFVAVSQMFRYLALAFAPLSVVVPIQRLSVVFRLLFNGLINREHEVFDRWIVVSILFAVVGAIALTADTDMLLGALNAPDRLVAILATPLF